MFYFFEIFIETRQLFDALYNILYMHVCIFFNRLDYFQEHGHGLNTKQYFLIYKTYYKINQGPDRTSLTSVEMETEEKEATDLAKTSELSDTEEEKIEDKKSDKKEEEQKKVSFSTYFKFLLVMINSTLTSMTKYLNRFSHDYRYIRKVLAKEKKILKVQIIFKKLIWIKYYNIFLIILTIIIFRQNQILKWERD